MTEPQEPTITDGQPPPQDVEAPTRQPLLYRLRYAAHKRFPRLVLRPHVAPRLEVWRRRDPEENAKTTPPADEFIDLRCLWAVEFYTPAHMDALLGNFRQLGWDKEDSSGVRNDPAAWVQRLREHPYGGGWLNLGVIRPSGTETFFLPPCHTAPLPPHVQYATAELHSLTSSLTCIVMGFVFEESFSRQFDRALRSERQTYAKPLTSGHQIYGPRAQKADHIRQIRADLGGLAAAWFSENLPGLFSSGVLGGALPTCEFVSLRQAEPFPPRHERSARLPEYLSALGMDFDFDTWRSADIPGLKFTVSKRRSRAPQYHSILAVRESDFDQEKLKSWGEPSRSAQINYIDHMIKGVLSRWAILPMLEGYGRHLNEIRDSATFRPNTRHKPVEVLEILGAHISYNVDVAAVTAELIPYAQNRSLFGNDVEAFEPCDNEHYEADYTLVKGLCFEIGERAAWLQKTDRSIRDHLTQYGSLLGAKENIRFQKRLGFLTVTIIFLTLAMLGTAAADSEAVSKFLQWVQGIWVNRYS